MAAKKGLTKISSVLERYQINEDKYVSREFQQYGYDLAEELGDMSHKALYIKLAKTYPREKLEVARRFVRDANNAKSKGRLFMWKLSQLKILEAEKAKAKKQLSG